MADARGAQATEHFEKKEKATPSSVFHAFLGATCEQPQTAGEYQWLSEEYPRKHSRLFQVNVNSKVNIKCTSV